MRRALYGCRVSVGRCVPVPVGLSVAVTAVDISSLVCLWDSPFKFVSGCRCVCSPQQDQRGDKLSPFDQLSVPGYVSYQVRCAEYEVLCVLLACTYALLITVHGIVLS